MSLVAYGSSGESENEEEHFDSEHTQQITLNVTSNAASTSKVIGTPLDIETNKDSSNTISSSRIAALQFAETSIKREDLGCDSPTNLEKEEQESINLFSTLPTPKTSIYSLNVDYTDKLLSVNSKALDRKETVKITIPALSEFDDTVEPMKKKLKPSSTGSGLFSLLPAPKNLLVKETKRPLVPHVLKKKTLPVSPKISVISAPEINQLDEDNNDDPIDFFSLNSDENEDLQNPHMASSMLIVETPEQRQAPVFGTSVLGPEPSPVLEVVHQSTPMAGSSSQTMEPTQDLQLSKEALQRLCGSRSKRNLEQTTLIDVSGDAIMPNSKEWLTKQISEEQVTKSHSHRKNDGPTTQQRRKHHITYLAFQAKENELELKNQWSQNRMSRKQTQSKYGF